MSFAESDDVIQVEEILDSDHEFKDSYSEEKSDGNKENFKGANIKMLGNLYNESSRTPSKRSSLLTK